jgi:allantoinase
MKYKFVPISQRKPLRWPNGKRLAVMITTNLEYWDVTKNTPKPFYPGGPGIVGGDLPGNVYDWTWREYGQRVGVWRMFDIFDEFGQEHHPQQRWICYFGWEREIRHHE